MAISVDPPPENRIPEEFLKNLATRKFFEQQQRILFQLWKRTGGSSDNVAGSQIITTTSSDLVLDDSAYGQLIIVDADTAPVQITLPPITDNTTGEVVDIAIIDATFDTTVIPSGVGVTVFGDTSVIMNVQWMSIQYTTISTTAWLGT